MKNAILVLMALVLVTLASIVPWADAQQKPANVLIWCQNTNGTSSPCVAGNALDYDSGGGTVNQSTVGLVFPASGGPVAAPGNGTDGLLVNLGANNDVTVTGSVTANAGTNLNTSALLTTSAHDAAFGTAGTADTQVRTVQGIASMTPIQVQSNSANLATLAEQQTQTTALQLIDNLPLAQGAATSGQNGVLVQGAVTTAAPTYTTGTTNPISLQTDGSQRVAVTNTPSVAQSGTWNINSVTTLPALPANQSVNVAQINGVTPLMGAGNTGTGSHRVTEATDSQLSAGVGATGDAAATAGSTGSMNAKLRLMSSQLDTISTSLSTLITSSQLVDDDQTGATMAHRISVGTTEDEHQVKGSAGRLFSINVTNTNAAVRYLRCADQVAASTTPGTTTVWYGMAIPGATTGAGYTANFGPAGVAFSTGLTCWLVTGAAESDVAEVAANEINVNYTYK